MPPPTPTLRTTRLTLRPWDPDSPDDVAAAFDLYRRDEVARWLGAAPAPWPSLEASRERLRGWQRVSAEHPGFGLWAVVPDAVAQPVGTALLVYLPDADGHLTGDVEIGWHFHPDHWGNGYATEAATALVNHGFGVLELETINALGYPGNEPSFAVMRRLGMTPRGETDRWYGVHLQWWSLARNAAAIPE